MADALVCPNPLHAHIWYQQKFFADMHMVVKFHSQEHSLMKSMVMLSVLYNNTKNTWQVKKIRCNKSAD